MVLYAPHSTSSTFCAQLSRCGGTETRHLAHVEVWQVRQEVVANKKAEQDPVVQQPLKVILKLELALS